MLCKTFDREEWLPWHFIEDVDEGFSEGFGVYLVLWTHGLSFITTILLYQMITSSNSFLWENQPSEYS